MSYVYAYDPVGNRTRTVTNEASASYTTTPLNQYSSREVPPRVEVQGEVSSLSPSRRVLGVNGQPVTLDGHGHFYSTIPVNNNEGPRWQEARIAAARKGAADPQDPDVADTNHGHIYLAKNPESFAYDADGNLTSDGRWTYSWDSENRLIRVETGAPALAAGVPAVRVECTYDYRGRRQTKTESELSGSDWMEKTSIDFAYGDGWELLAEYDAGHSNALLRSYVWGLDLSSRRSGAGGVGGLLSLQVGGKVLVPAYDGNGNVVGLGDEMGVEVGHYDYGPFGEPLRATRAMANGNPFRFSTHYCDDETGHCCYGYRFYDPYFGRWINRDPIGERGGGNLMAFVGNDAVTYFDILGLLKWRITDEVFVVPGTSAKSINCAKLTLSSVYLDADLRSTFQQTDPAAYYNMTSLVPGGAYPLATAKGNQPGYLGAGFVLNAALTPSTDPKNPCCCKSFKWKQEVVGTIWNSTDYQWDATTHPAVDFPGDTYSGIFNRDKTLSFVLKLICIDKSGKAKEIYKIPWSQNTKVDADKSPSSATVTLTIDW